MSRWVRDPPDPCWRGSTGGGIYCDNLNINNNKYYYFPQWKDGQENVPLKKKSTV